MKLAEILPEIEKGRRFRRKQWAAKVYICAKDSQGFFYPDSLLADDWELEPEPEKREMAIVGLNSCHINSFGQFRYIKHDDYALTKPQRRALAHAIRTLLKEFEGETE